MARTLRILVIVALMVGMASALANAAEGDLDNYCQAWQAQPGCTEEQPFLPCPGPEMSTGEYLMDFETYYGVPGAAGVEASVRITNNNPGIRVKVRRYGTAVNTNIYFQNDAPDALGCNGNCEFEDTPPGFCRSPPCEFEGECQGCVGQACYCHDDTCPGDSDPDACNGTDCDVMSNGKTCGCEVLAKHVYLDRSGQSGDEDVDTSCRLPLGGSPNCDLGPPASPPYNFCLYLSPTVEHDGIHFAIEELNFSNNDDCWYPLPNRIVIDQEDIDESWHEDCPEPDNFNPPRTCG